MAKPKKTAKAKPKKTAKAKPKKTAKAKPKKTAKAKPKKSTKKSIKHLNNFKPINPASFEAHPIDGANIAQTYDLEEWQKHFAGIYFTNNRKIKKSVYKNDQIAFLRGYVISNITQDLGDLAEAIRESNDEAVKKYVGSMFAWIFALSNEIEEDLHSMLWEKFPGFCRYCGNKYYCSCAYWIPSQLQKNKNSLKNKPNDNESPHTKPPSLEGYLAIWDSIYGAKYKIALSISEIMYKLFEEQAEILAALNHIKPGTTPRDSEEWVELTREVADFTSWVFALILKLKDAIPRQELACVLFEKFGNGCKRCTSHIPCKCTPNWHK